jgi:hypothetical protein
MHELITDLRMLSQPFSKSCRVCLANVPETEEHFLMNCSACTQSRRVMWLNIEANLAQADLVNAWLTISLSPPSTRFEFLLGRTELHWHPEVAHIVDSFVRPFLLNVAYKRKRLFLTCNQTVHFFIELQKYNTIVYHTGQLRCKTFGRRTAAVTAQIRHFDRTNLNYRLLVGHAKAAPRKFDGRAESGQNGGNSGTRIVVLTYVQKSVPSKVPGTTACYAMASSTG